MKVFTKLFISTFLMFITSAGTAVAADGASGGTRFLDMILLGVVVFLVFRIIRRRSGRWSDPHDEQLDDRGKNKRERSTPTPPQNRHEQARAMWDMLSDSGERPGQPARRMSPDGFDEAEFLEGAKLFYSRFQEARDSGNWETVAPFIEPGLLGDLMRDSGAGSAARSEIMLLDAKVMDLRTENGRTEVTVFFDASLRRGASGERQVNERNAWEFSREDQNSEALWVLERINKIDH